MSPTLPDPVRPTETVISWLVDNRDGVLLGLLVAAGIVGLMLLARAIGQRMVRSDPTHLGWRSVVGRVLARTSVAFMVVAALAIVANYAQPPARGQRLVDILFTIAAALQAAVWARELALAMIARRVGENPGETTLGNATAIIRVLLSVAVFGLAIIAILDNLGVNVTALVAGLGIGGIAIGLAAQGIFSDLFAALAIVFDRPFRRGDTIRYDTTTGTVERIGLKTTRLRALSGELVVMANTKLLEREVRNLAAGEDRRVTIPFGLVYQTPIDTLARVADIAGEVVESVADCKRFRCTLVAFGPSSLDHELVYDDGSIDGDRLARNKGEIILRLLKRFAEEGIQFAYPTQTTFTAAPDGTLVMPWAPPPER